MTESTLAPPVMTQLDKKKQVVSFLMRNNVLVTPSIISKLADNDFLENARNMIMANSHLSEIRSFFGLAPSLAPDVIVTKNPIVEGRKVVVDDFVSYFRNRYRSISSLLRERQDLQQAIAIGRLKDRKKEGNNKEKVCFIGFVFDKQETKNGSLIFNIEDPTGSVKVIVGKSKEDLMAKAKDTMLDEVVGIIGQGDSDVVFASDIIVPDVPVTHELKKSPIDDHIIMISDVHVGSKLFLDKQLSSLVNWLRGEDTVFASKELASKVRYVFIVGDLVDGVGIYPKQEDELEIKDINQQYEKFASFISRIPSSIRVVICPGNHDAVRIAEPQPLIPKHMLNSLYNLPNVTFVANPAVVVIGRTPVFSGFDVLLYHGFSFDDYGDIVESIRREGKNISERANPVMRYLLTRRHLAPTVDSTQFIVDRDQDCLVIDKVPDFFLSGHIHRSSHSVYRGVQIISGSCWQTPTAFQEKIGHKPDMCRVPIVNLQTREIAVLDFSGGLNDSRV